MASRIAALSKAKTKAFTHRNREASKFQFELTVHGLKGLDHSLAADLCVQIVRGPKVVVTGAASVAVGAASWEEAKTLVCTLHASKKSDVMFSEKTFGVKVLAMKRGVPKSELASAELNLASFATIDARSTTTEHTLLLTPKGAPKSAPSGPELSLTVTATFLKDLEVDPDEQSMSSQMPALGAGPSGVRATEGLASEQDLRGFEEAAAAPSAALDELRSVRQGLTEDIQRRRGEGLPPLRRTASVEAGEAAAERAQLQAGLDSLREELRATHTKQAEAEVAREAAVADLGRAQRLAAQAAAESERKVASLEAAAAAAAQARRSPTLAPLASAARHLAGTRGTAARAVATTPAPARATRARTPPLRGAGAGPGRGAARRAQGRAPDRERRAGGAGHGLGADPRDAARGAAEGRGGGEGAR